MTSSHSETARGGESGEVDSRSQTETPLAVEPSLRARILLHSGIQLAGRAVSAIGSVALLWILTRYLGTDGFGRYTFVVAYISLFYVVTDLGSQAIAVREMAREPARASELAGQLFTVKLGMSGFALGAALILMWILPVHSFAEPGVRTAIVYGGIALLAVPFLASGGAVFQTNIRMGIPALADVAARLLTLGCVAVLAGNILLGPTAGPADRLAAVLLAGTAGSLLGATVMFRGAWRLIRVRPRWDIARSSPLIRDAIPLAIVFILGIIHYRIDVFVLSLMKGMHTVGLYGVATKLLDIALAGSTVFMGLAFPVFSGRVAGDPALLQRAFQKALDLVLIAGVGAAVFSSLLASEVVSAVAGSQYSGATIPVAIIAWAIPITFANTVFAHMVVAANLQRRAVPISLAAIVLNIGLNVLLIPRYGASASALTTVVTEALGTLGIGAIMVIHYGFGPSIASLGRIATAGAIAGVTLFLLRSVSLAPAIVFSAAAYVVSLFALRAVTIADMQTILRRGVG